MQSKAFKDGETSYFRFRGAYQNRYCPGTPGHGDFERGWKSALRQDPSLREEYEVNRARRAMRRNQFERQPIPNAQLRLWA